MIQVLIVLELIWSTIGQVSFDIESLLQAVVSPPSLPTSLSYLNEQPWVLSCDIAATIRLENI